MCESSPHGSPSEHVTRWRLPWRTRRWTGRYRYQSEGSRWDWTAPRPAPAAGHPVTAPGGRATGAPRPDPVPPARRAAARRGTAPGAGRLAALLPGASGPVGGPARAAGGDGPQHRRHLRAVELPPAPPRRPPLRRPARPRPLPGPGAGRRPGRDRAAGPVHLRRVGQRRAARLADRHAGDAAALLAPAVPGRGGALVRRADPADRGGAGGVRRPGRRGAGGERVRQLRRRPRVSGVAARRADRARHQRAAVHRRRADRADAGRRHPAGRAGDRDLRVARGAGGRAAAVAAPRRAVRVRRVLERLVRPLGREPPRTGAGERRRRPRRHPGRGRVGELLHGARRHQLRPVGGRQPRRQPAPAHRHQLRLRRADRRTRRPAAEVLPAARPAAGADRRRREAAAAARAAARPAHPDARAGRRAARRARPRCRWPCAPRTR